MRNILNGVRSTCGNVWNFTVGSITPVVKHPTAFVVGFLFCCFMAFGGMEALAQTQAQDVPFNPIVNFGDLFDQLRGPVATVVVGALGLGLAIWGARYLFRIIKSMGR